MSKPRLYLINGSTQPISNFALHYYFTVDAGKTPVLEDYFTPNSTAQLQQVSGSVWRVVYQFLGVTLNPGQATDTNSPPSGNVVGLHYSDWSTWNKTDDWSHAGVAGTFVQTQNVPVLDAQGYWVSGNPPAGVTLPTAPAPQTTATRRLWFSVDLPTSMPLGQIAIGASGDLVVGDGAQITANSTSGKANIVNLGSGTTETGKNAKSGSVLGAGNVTIRGSQIYGDAVASGILTVQAGSSVTGTQYPSGTPIPKRTQTWSVVASGTPQTIPSGNGPVLTPGRWGAVRLTSGQTLRFSTAGVYFLDSLQTDYGSVLYFDNSNGPIFVHVENSPFSYRSLVTKTSQLDNIEFTYSGTTTAVIEKTFPGVLIAPSASIDLGTYPGYGQTGAFFGRNVTVRANTPIVARPLTLNCSAEVAACRPSLACTLPDADGDLLADCEETRDASLWTNPDIENGIYITRTTACTPATGNGCALIDTRAEFDACASGQGVERDAFSSGWSWQTPTTTNYCDRAYGFSPSWQQCPATGSLFGEGYFLVENSGHQCFRVEADTTASCGVLYIGSSSSGLLPGTTHCSVMNRGVVPLRWGRVSRVGTRAPFTLLHCGGGQAACTPTTPIDVQSFRLDGCEPDECTDVCTCDAGEGTCASNSDCASGLACVPGNGPLFHNPAGTSVCVNPQCAADPLLDGCHAGAVECATTADCGSGETCSTVQEDFGYAAPTQVCVNSTLCSGAQAATLCGDFGAPCGLCECIPDCSGKTCGGGSPADGCGGYCSNYCAAGQTGCQWDIECPDDNSCTDEGRCLPDSCFNPFTCDPTVCGDRCAAACVPACEGLACGDDPNCGVPCGDCPSGQTCDGNACIPTPPDPATLPPALVDVETVSTIGSIDGGYSLSNRGTVQYDVRFDFPAGRGGIKPNLGLHYDGTAVSGNAGAGWNLTGLSRIARCPRTAALDGWPSPPSGSETDAFCLDGQRLVYFGGAAEGQDGAEYRTERESFQKIVYHRRGATPSVEHPTDYWEVRPKTGGVLYFGQAGVVAKTDFAVTQDWVLVDVFDVSGNRVRFFYHNAHQVDCEPEPEDQFDTTNPVMDPGEPALKRCVDAAPYLTAVNYGGRIDEPGAHRLEVYWETPALTFTRVLSAVVVKYGNEILKYYKLTNAEVGASPGFITSIRECLWPTSNGTETCLSPTTFEYADYQPSAEDSLTGIPQQFGPERELADVGPKGSCDEGFSGCADTAKGHEFTIDANGDGLLDLLFAEDRWTSTNGVTGKRTWRLSLGGMQGGSYVLGTPQTITTVTSSLSDRMKPTSACFGPASVVDIDGDGLSDLVDGCAQSGKGFVWLASVDDDNVTFTKTQVVSGLTTGDRVFAADFDGTGFPSLVSCSASTVLVHTWTPGGLLNATPDVASTSLPAGATCDWQDSERPEVSPLLFDADGDGALNLVVRSGDNIFALAGEDLQWRQLGIHSFSVGSFDTYKAGYGAIKILDAGGDGRADLLDEGALVETSRTNGASRTQISYTTTTSTATERSYLWRQGSGGSWEPTQVKAPSYAGLDREVFDGLSSLDVDADGFQDLFGFVKSGTGRVALQISTRDFNRATAQSDRLLFRTGPSVFANANFSKNRQSPILADFNGDGAIDVLFDGGSKRLLHEGLLPEHHRMTRLLDGFGNTLTFTYDTDGTAYTKGTCDPLRSCLSRVGPVLRTVERGSSLGPQSISTYSYSDAQMGRWGRGWLGFGEIKEEVELLANDPAQPAAIVPVHQRTLTTRLNNGAGYDVRRYHDYLGAGLATEVIEESAAVPAGVPTGSAAPLSRTLLTTRLTNAWTESLAGRPFTCLAGRVTKEEAEGEDGAFHLVREEQLERGIPDAAPMCDEWGRPVIEFVRIFDAAGVEHSVKATSFIYFPADTSTWRLAALARQVTYGYSDTDAQVREVWFDYDGYGRLLHVTRAPSVPELERTTSYDYDAYGNVLGTSEHDATGSLQRQSTTEFDPSGLRPTLGRNAMGHQTLLQVDPGTGRLLSTVDPNGLVTRYAYDGFGRQTLTESATGRREVRLGAPQTPGAALRVSTIESDARAASTRATEYDSLGRVVYEAVDGIGGTQIQRTQRYTQGTNGLDVAISAWHPVTSGAAAVTTYAFDLLGNLRSETGPDPAGGQSSVTYDYATIVTAPELQGTLPFTRVRRRVDRDGVESLTYLDERGRVNQTVRGEDERFIAYGPFDVVEEHQAPSGIESIESDAFGRTTAVTDPDLHTVATSYDAFDRVKRVVNADGSLDVPHYDALDRVTQIDHDLATDRFYYDTDPVAVANGESTPNAVGRLLRTQRQTSSGVVERVLRYEPPLGSGAGFQLANRGLLRSVAVVAAGKTLTTTIDYEFGTSRPIVMHYPDVGAGAFSVRNCYDAQGALVEVLDGESSTGCGNGPSFWKRTGVFRGLAISSTQAGNGVTTDLNFDADTLMLQDITVTRGTESLKHAYAYLPTGQLQTYTHEPVSGTQKAYSYSYDPAGMLQRITSGGNATYQASFDAALRMQDVDRGTAGLLGPYNYEPATSGSGFANRPSVIGANSFHYDGRGNQDLRDGPDIVGQLQKIEYNDFNLPIRIETGVTGNHVTSFEYDAERVRATMQEGTHAAWYLGDTFDVHEDPSGQGTTEERHEYYVYAGAEAVAQVVRTRANASQSFGESVLYLHHDRLGSLVATSGTGSGSIQEYTYDTLGTPQQPLPIPFGFTGHRHEQSLGLVDAKGRFYDPTFGIFLSADPIGPLSGSSPFGNRYAYAGYDPINSVDPSGFQFIDDGGLDCARSNSPTCGGGGTISIGGGGSSGVDDTGSNSNLGRNVVAGGVIGIVIIGVGTAIVKGIGAFVDWLSDSPPGLPSIRAISGGGTFAGPSTAGDGVLTMGASAPNQASAEARLNEEWAAIRGGGARDQRVACYPACSLNPRAEFPTQGAWNMYVVGVHISEAALTLADVGVSVYGWFGGAARGQSVIGGLDEISQLSFGNNGLSGMRQFVVNENLWKGLSDVERWALNQRWLDAGIKAGEEFVVAGRNYGAGTLREIKYLIDAGYTAVRSEAGDIVKLVPGP